MIIGKSVQKSQHRLHAERRNAGLSFLKGDTPQKKWQYFKDYYLPGTVIAAFFIVLAAAFVCQTVIRQKEITSAIVIEDSDTIDTKALRSDLEKLLDVGKKEQVEVTAYPSGDSAVHMTLLVRFTAGDIDIFIAERENFEAYAQSGMMEDLKKILPEELCGALQDRMARFSIVTRDEQGNVTAKGEERDYGLSLKGLKCFEQYNAQMTDPVLGIAAAPDPVDDELWIIRYLTDK